MSETNEQRENRIFNAFLQASGLNGRFEHRTPPHPDILCFSDKNKPIAFELVELIDNGYARRLGQMFGTLSDLPKYFDLQPEAIRDEIERKFSNAMILVQFSNAVSMPQRRNLFEDIFAAIAISEFEGTGDIPLGGRLSNFLERITVYRGDIDGPRFETTSSGYLSDPTERAIRSKFAKKYNSEGPLHLLA